MHSRSYQVSLIWLDLNRNQLLAPDARPTMDVLQSSYAVLHISIRSTVKNAGADLLR